MIVFINENTDELTSFNAIFQEMNIAVNELVNECEISLMQYKYSSALCEAGLEPICEAFNPVKMATELCNKFLKILQTAKERIKEKYNKLKKKHYEKKATKQYDEEHTKEAEMHSDPRNQEKLKDDEKIEKVEAEIVTGKELEKINKQFEKAKSTAKKETSKINSNSTKDDVYNLGKLLNDLTKGFTIKFY